MRLALAALSLFTASAFAMDLKGVAIGMPAAKVLEKYPHLKCAPMSQNREVCGDERPADKPTYNMVSPELETFGGERVLSFIVGMRDGGVHLVMVKLESSGYDAVAAALTEKYGKPFSQKSSTIQNRMGASFDQDAKIWKSGVFRILALKRGSRDLQKMEVSLASESGVREETERAKDKAKAGAGDL